MVAQTQLLAAALSIGAALVGAGHHLLIRVGTDEGRPQDAVLVVMVVNVAVLVPVVGVVYYPEYGLTSRSVLSFVAAGVFGTLLGRLFLYTSIDRIGASRTTPLIATWVLISALLGVVVLDESPTPAHAVGIVLILLGVAGIAWETGSENPDDLSRRELALGLVFPLAGALAFGAEPIYASLGFAEGTPAPVGLVVKTVAATLGFTLYLGWRRSLPGTVAFRGRDGRWFLLAGVANTLFLLGYYVALALAPVTLVVPLIVTNTLFVLLLSWLFVPDRLERVTRRLVVASGLVVASVVLILLSG